MSLTTAFCHPLDMLWRSYRNDLIGSDSSTTLSRPIRVRFMPLVAIDNFA